jgi:hypothetical protein
MADNQAALDTALTALGTAITNEDSGVTTIIAEVTALIAKVQANPTGDFTSEVTALNSMAADLTTQATNLQAAIAAAKPVTGQ